MALRWGRRTAGGPWPALVGALAGLAVFLLAHRALPDDAYITMGYARNLAETGHWGLLADRASNTATSPLNVWLLAAVTAPTGRPVLAVAALLVASTSAAGWWADGLRRELGLPRAMPYLVVAVLASSPLLVSSVGLETFLGAAVLLGVARYATAGRVVATGLLVGVAVLVRPDLAVPAGVLALVLPAVPTVRRGVMTALVAAAVALPWHLVSWVLLGGFLPDTLWFKSGDPWQLDGRTWVFADGWGFYAHTEPVATVLAGLPAAAGLVAALVWSLTGRGLPGRRAALGFATAGAAHWLAYAALGTAPYSWYLAPSAVCWSVTAVLAACASASARPGLLAWAPLGALGGVVAASAAFLVLAWPWALAPLSTNWGSAGQYAAMATELGRVTRGEPVSSEGEIGAVTYFCRCPVLDWFGDRARTDALIGSRVGAGSPVTRAVASWNFRFREPTPPTPTRWALVPGDVQGAVARWRLDNADRHARWVSLTVGPTR